MCFVPCLQREVQRDEDRELREERQARRGRVDVVLLVELHQLFVQLRAVALVLLLDRLHLRRVRLERLHRMDLPDRERHEDDPREDGQRDDRPRPRQADRAVEEVEDRLHHVLERRAGSRRRAARRGSRVVDPSVRPRVTAQQAPARERQPAQHAVLADRERGVLRAARVVLAGVRRDERRDQPLVEPDRRMATRAQGLPSCRCLPEHLVDAGLSHSWPFASAASGKPWRTTST